MKTRARSRIRGVRGLCLFATWAISASGYAQERDASTATVARLIIEACDESLRGAIRAAMQLEVGAGIALVEEDPAAGTDLRFHVIAPCSDPSLVELEDDLTGLVVRRAIVLGDVPTDLRPRMIALVAHELARLDRNARATRLARTEPTELLAPSTDDTDDERESPIPDESSRPAVAQPTENTSTRSRARPITIGVEAGVRAFVRTPVFLEGGRVGVSRGRFSTGVLAVGNRVAVDFGSVGVLSTTMDVGVRLWPRDASESAFSLHLRAEAGIVRTVGRPAEPTPNLAGLRALSFAAGGSLDAALVFPLRDVDAAVRFDFELGAMAGPRVTPAWPESGERTIDVTGFMAGSRVGLEI